jgi:hypothetical protein
MMRLALMYAEKYDISMILLHNEMICDSVLDKNR